MTPRHPLDGNAIAADRHYDQPAPTDHDCCDQCGAPFGDPDDDPDCVVQDAVAFMWCETCAEAHGDEK